MWAIPHIYFLIGVRQPIFVGLSWLWSYITYSKGARLITGDRQPPEPPETPPVPLPPEPPSVRPH